MPNRRPTQHASVGTLEAVVLETLWEHGELATRSVHELVGVPRGLAYTTVLTVLQRLTRKRLTSRKTGQRGHVYSPAVTRDQFAALRGASLASAFVKMGDAGVAAFLTEAQRLDPEIVAALRKRLRTHR